MVYKRLKSMILGDPLPNWANIHEKLSKKLALPVFSSDALSSVAYATEEILLILILAGLPALFYSIPISLAVIMLLIILVISYSQTIKAYPQGGGSYLVSKDNLGTTPSLVAASSLMINYVLTVAVSVAAGVAAITSAFPGLYSHRVLFCILAICLITIINLKGMRDSSLLFAFPTYFFIITMIGMIIYGIFKYANHSLVQFVPDSSLAFTSGITLFLIARAFASGCTALTGIEAIADGVPAFKKPESRNASITLITMGVLLAVMFFGITFLAFHAHVIPAQDRTIVSLLAEDIFGGKNIFFYFVQAATMLILLLAANTGFVDFPRICYFLAKDGFIPKQFTYIGDRLVYSNGIIFLGGVSAILIIMFNGNVHHLIPLYAVGVFTAFTLSQAAMVKKHLKDKVPRWQLSAIINSIGMILTFIALAIIVITKFASGAWLVILLIPAMIIVFREIKSHYSHMSQRLSIYYAPHRKFERGEHLFIISVNSVNITVLNAVNFARSLHEKIIAVHVSVNAKESEEIMKEWEKLDLGMKLVIIESPYRARVTPMMKYIDTLEQGNHKLNVTVIIPEYVPSKWYHFLLHNQSSLMLKAAIHFRKRTHFMNVQYHTS